MVRRTLMVGLFAGGVLVGMQLGSVTAASSSYIGEGRHMEQGGGITGVDGYLYCYDTQFAYCRHGLNSEQLVLRMSLEQGTDWDQPPTLFSMAGMYLLRYAGDWQHFVYWNPGGGVEGEDLGVAHATIHNFYTVKYYSTFCQASQGSIQGPCVETWVRGHWEVSKPFNLLPVFHRVLAGAQALADGPGGFEMAGVAAYNIWRDNVHNWHDYPGTPYVQESPFTVVSLGSNTWQFDTGYGTPTY